MPPLQSLHPAIVHFPIALFLIAWLPMLLAILDKKRRNPWLTSAAMLLIGATISAFIATFTGEAAAEIVGSTTDEISKALHTHEEAAESARNLILACTLVFLMVWAVCNKAPDKKKPTLALVGTTLILITYALATNTLIKAGHLGGLLVHKHGVHAPITGPGAINVVVDD